MRKIIVKTISKNYPIIIGYDLIKDLNKNFIKNSVNCSKYFFVIDTKIPRKTIPLIKKQFKRKKIIFYKFNSNEKNKSFIKINHITNILQKENFNRNDCVVAIGGGIVGDVSSFAASIFKRGLKFINIPTTLLAQVDSSIGGKTGINTKFGKNLIGSFYQPNLVISDINFLKTLPKREILCGYGEILKHSIIKSKKLFNYLSKYLDEIINLKNPYIQKVIFDSCMIKKEIVEKDVNEKNLRKILNFGHTFGHAYEATLGYSKKLNHGEAVILGIKSASEFSFKKKLLKLKDYKIIKNHLSNFDKSLKLKYFFKKKDIPKILSFLKSDKKNTNEDINLILLENFEKVSFNKFYKISEIKIFLKSHINSI
tara:strand:+ start:660 stop:1763 length:1104 start_codon:yes stop_codon:yes gene_type:complete